VTVQTFTTVGGDGEPVDFDVQLASCELFSPLEFDFEGSPPARTYARQPSKTKTRTVTMSDAGTFYSASRLQAAVAPADRTLELATIFTQLVPNTRTETPLLNQRPAGVRALSLVDSLGTLVVSDAVHTTRIFVTEANQGNSYVFRLSPPPAPGSVTASYFSQGSWASVTDDGAGAIAGGPGSGTVLYTTGDVSLTTESLPDYNTFILLTWASNAPFVNACAGGQIVLPTAITFDLAIEPGSQVSGATIAWESGGVARTAVASASGVLSGDATGQMISSLGRVLLSTQHMPDAAANFTITYAGRPQVTVTSSAITPGQNSLTLALPSEPIPGTVVARFTSVQNVSASSGADLTGTAQGNPLSANHRRTVLETSPIQQVVANEVSDDGLGNIGGLGAGLGSVNYGGQSITINLVATQSVLGYQSDLERTGPFMVAVAALSGA
jgi:hypothetical protein